MTQDDWYPLDQEFLPREAVKAEVVNQLATLERDKLRVRIALVMAGGNLDAPLQNGSTIGQQLDTYERQMIALKSKFVEVLVTPSA